MPSLRVLSNDAHAAREIVFTSDEVTIGRDPDNVLVLDGAKVSRRHARILATAHGYMLVDADSVNGVLVGQERVRHHFLKSGEVFQIGKHLIRFVDEEALAPTLVGDLRQVPHRTPRSQAFPPPDSVTAPPPVDAVVAVCARCGAQRPVQVPACPACGTAVRPRPHASMRWGLWIAAFLALSGLALIAAVAAYVFRDAWVPVVRRLVSRPVEVKSVAPELAEFGPFAKVRSAEAEFGVGPSASSHALDEAARLEIPAGAFASKTHLVSSVVDLGAERASDNVRSSIAFVITAPEGTSLAQPILIEIARPTERVTVTEAYGDGWRTVDVGDGPTVRIPIEHFSRRTFAVVEWKDADAKAMASQAPAIMIMDGSGGVNTGLAGDTIGNAGSVTAAPLPPPSPRNPIRDDPNYQKFIGAEPSARYFPGRTEFCTALTARAMNFPGLSFDPPKLDGVEVPRPEAGLPNGTPFEQLMIAAVDPKEQNKNPYVRLTNDPVGPDGRSREQRLEDAILASSGNLTPADIMEMSLRACDGNYKLASLTAHNLLKNIAYQGRQQSSLVAGLMARGRTDIPFPERYGEVASRLVNLRGAPGDKMGIWYHAFVPLAISAWTDPGEADWAITQEYVVRWLGSLTNMGSPMDPEKQASDRCFAESARDIHARRPSTSAPGDLVPTTRPAPPPPPAPAPVSGSTGAGGATGADAPCPPNPPVAHKCPWTPDGFSVGECGKGFCWDGGPQGFLACKQEKDPANGRRNENNNVECAEGFTRKVDRCSGEILSCEK